MSLAARLAASVHRHARRSAAARLHAAAQAAFESLEGRRLFNITITGYVWTDKNGNGSRQDNEGVAGITVWDHRPGPTTVTANSTGRDGKYTFCFASTDWQSHQIELPLSSTLPRGWVQSYPTPSPPVGGLYPNANVTPPATTGSGYDFRISRPWSPPPVVSPPPADTNSKPDDCGCGKASSNPKAGGGGAGGGTGGGLAGGAAGGAGSAGSGPGGGKGAPTTQPFVPGMSRPNAASRYPVRYADGVMYEGATDLSADGFGMPWGHARSWSNGAGYARTSANGNGWVTDALPNLFLDSSGSVAVVLGGSDAQWFDVDPAGGYRARHDARDTLTYAPSDEGGDPSEFVLTVAGDGTQIRFFDPWLADLPDAQRGAFKSRQAPGGERLRAFSFDADGRPTELRRSVTAGGVTTVESWRYAYLQSPDVNAGKLASVRLGRKSGVGLDPNGAIATFDEVRRADYLYYEGDSAGTGPGTAEQAYGLRGDLRAAKVSDGAGNRIDTWHYRYYTADTNDGGGNRIGYAGGLRAVLDPEGYARLDAALAQVTGAPGDAPLYASDATLAAYAARAYQYNSDRRVTQEVVAEAGSSQTAAGGRGTIRYAYLTNTSAPAPTSYNSWVMRTIETQLDAAGVAVAKTTVFTNRVGDVMLRVYEEQASGQSFSNKKLATFHKYDADGRLVMTAHPSAIKPDSGGNLYNQSYADLMHDTGGGNYEYLGDDFGQLDLFEYATADGSGIDRVTARDAAGLLKATRVKRGDVDVTDNVGVPSTLDDNPILVSETKYYKVAFAPSVAGRAGATLYPVASTTVYPDATERAAGAGRATTYEYDWYGASGSDFATLSPKSVRTVRPIVSLGTNGPGGSTNDADLVYLDARGNPTWSKDAGGYVSYVAWDPVTGAATTSIVDVNTARDSDDDGDDDEASGGATFAGRPADLDAPGSGTRLGLTTLVVPDALGRPRKVTDPNGRVTFTLYDDAGHEVQVFRGWDATAHTVTGPVEVVRAYRSADNAAAGEQVYTEALATSAGPTYNSTTNEPTGVGTIDASNIHSLTRSLTNEAGQVTKAYAFFSLAGVTYSRPDADLNNAASNDTIAGSVHVAEYGYDAMGRLSVTKSPTGTIVRTVFDHRGNAVATYVGTNDAGATDLDPDGSGGTNNMVKVSEAEYDQSCGCPNSSGDGNPTKVTAYPGGGAAARVTENYYDWRGRLVAAKSGIETTEATGVQRSITYVDLNNLGQVTASYAYDGDNVAVTETNGTPDKPSASLRRARTTVAYDEQLRPYKQEVYSVDPSTGAASTAALTTKTYYDPRGNVVATAAPGGLVSEAVYDGAGRVITTYLTDGAGGTDWDDAGNPAGDHVLEQAEYVYDGVGNVLLTTARQRMHDEADAGALGGPTSTVRARVSYAANYYDAADRPTASVAVGTNGGSAYTRPLTAPARSDTVLVTSYAYDAAGRLQGVTDPRGTVARTAYDLLGRTTKTTDAYDSTVNSGNPTDIANRSTLYTYDGAGHVLTMTADMPTGTADQTTAYVYDDAWGTSGTPVHTNDLLREVRYPRTNSGTGTLGEADPNRKESYAYDALGEATSYTDKNGSVHAFAYDVLGRTLSDTVTTLGTGVDGAVRQLRTGYNTQGLADRFTSLGASASVALASGSTGTTVTATATAHGLAVGDTVEVTGAATAAYNGTFIVASVPTADTFTYAAASAPGGTGNTGTFRKLVNQVQRAFNGLGQLTAEYQAHDGAVITASTPKVQYTHTLMAGGANHSRLTRVTYPNGRVLRHQYLSGLDDKISRVSYLADDAGGSVGTHLEEYAYLGLGTVISQKHPEPGVDLTYVKQGSESDGSAGDQYAGLDRFGRVVDQRWRKPASGTEVDRFQYGYDRNSNVLYKDNKVSAANSELYHANGSTAGYDALDRLAGFARGTLSDANSDGVPDTVASASRSQSWDLDALGNWDSQSTTNSGTTTTDTRTHNAANQIATHSSPFTTTAPTYDAAGNLTNDGNPSTLGAYAYDAWNRVVAYGVGTCSASTYEYDALGRRAEQTVKYGRTVGSNYVTTTTDSDLYLSDQWQVLEERAAVAQSTCNVSSGTTTNTTFGRTDQQVWGLGYVDDLVLRDRLPSNTVDVGGAGQFGKRTTDFGGSGRTDVARAVVVQPDGKVVAAGSSTASGGGSSDLALARYTSTGSLDTTFDTDGKVQSSLGTVEGWSAAVLETDAQIVVGGYTTNGGGGTNFVLARYNANGTLDTAFDTDGFVVTVVSSGDDYVRGVVVQPDGKIVAVGDSINGSSVRVVTVARYNSDGSLDTTFSGDGIATATAGTGAAYGNAVALQPDGKIVVAGYATGSTSGTDMVALRFNPDGTLDDGSGSDTTSGDSFGTSGVATVDVALVTGGNDHAYAVALSPDGTVVLAGDAADASNTYLAVARLTAAGAADTSFATTGKLTGSTAGSEARAVAVDGLGRITAAGAAGTTGTGTGVDFALVRVWADGTYDTSFGASGQVGTDVGGSSADDRAYALALTVSGAVAAGASGGDFGVAVYQPTGTPAPQRLYALQDANYNVTALVTSGGSVAERFRYDPYGASTVLSSSFTATTDGYDWAYRHQGGRLEFATGAYHFRFRDYDPALGRWLGEDPERYIDGHNLYLYLLGRPALLLDPLGTESERKLRPVDPKELGTKPLHDEVVKGLRNEANPALKCPAQILGFFTTPFKDLGIQGWKPTGIRVAATGRVVRDAQHSSDGFYTIDVEVRSMKLSSGGFTSSGSFGKGNKKFIRIEVKPRHIPSEDHPAHSSCSSRQKANGGKAPFKKDDLIAVEGDLMVDTDPPLFYEIHPTDTPITLIQ